MGALIQWNSGSIESTVNSWNKCISPLLLAYWTCSTRRKSASQFIYFANTMAWRHPRTPAIAVCFRLFNYRVNDHAPQDNSVSHGTFKFTTIATRAKSCSRITASENDIPQNQRLPSKPISPNANRAQVQNLTYAVIQQLPLLVCSCYRHHSMYSCVTTIEEYWHTKFIKISCIIAIISKE